MRDPIAALLLFGAACLFVAAGCYVSDVAIARALCVCAGVPVGALVAFSAPRRAS